MTFIGEIFVGEVLNKPVLDPSGEEIGRVKDLLVSTGEPFPQVTSLIIKRKKRELIVPWDSINIFNRKVISSRIFKEELKEYLTSEIDILIGRDILDKQIVDINGVKVVRVNDIRLGEFDEKPCLVAVDIGMRGILRRLGLERRGEGIGMAIGYPLKHNLIGWNYIQPIEPRLTRLTLTIPRKSVAMLHPADIAHIISQVSMKERAALFDSLDLDTAAEALPELEPDVQTSIINQMGKEQASDLLEQMSPDEAADIIGDLSPEKAKEILELMEEEDAENVQELLSHDEDTAGGLMTTEYIAYHSGLSVGDTIERFKRDASDIDTVYYIYILDEEERLIGVISLRDLLLSNTDSLLSEVMTRKVKTITPETDQKQVAKIISKYNLVSLPVVDEHNRLLGVVTIDDVINIFMPKRKKPRV